MACPCCNFAAPASELSWHFWHLYEGSVLQALYSGLIEQTEEEKKNDPTAKPLRFISDEEVPGLLAHWLHLLYCQTYGISGCIVCMSHHDMARATPSAEAVAFSLVLRF